MKRVVITFKNNKIKELRDVKYISTFLPPYPLDKNRFIEIEDVNALKSVKKTFLFNPDEIKFIEIIED